MSRIRSRFFTAALAAVLGLFLVGNAVAQDASATGTQPATSNTQVPQGDSGVNWPGAGYGAAALFGNLLYIPAKLTYAILGGLVGGGTYLITAGNMQAADTVWRSSLGGDYVLTPQMIAGEQPINFSGPTETPAPPAATADSSGSGNVQPITPIPPPSTSSAAPAAVPAPAPAASNAKGMHPMDSGSGPVNKADSGLPSSSIE